MNRRRSVRTTTTGRTSPDDDVACCVLANRESRLKLASSETACAACCWSTRRDAYRASSSSICLASASPECSLEATAAAAVVVASAVILYAVPERAQRGRLRVQRVDGARVGLVDSRRTYPTRPRWTSRWIVTRPAGGFRAATARRRLECNPPPCCSGPPERLSRCLHRHALAPLRYTATGAMHETCRGCNAAAEHSPPLHVGYNTRERRPIRQHWCDCHLPRRRPPSRRQPSPIRRADAVAVRARNRIEWDADPGETSERLMARRVCDADPGKVLPRARPPR